jgi:hypothetical protein
MVNKMAVGEMVVLDDQATMESPTLEVDPATEVARISTTVAWL